MLGILAQKSYGWLKSKELQIVSGKSTDPISTIDSSEEFFLRSDTRSLKDVRHPSKLYTPSGPVTIIPDGQKII